MEKSFTIDEIIEKNNILDVKTKSDFKKIKQMFEALEEDFILLLFDLEFLNTLTYPWKEEDKNNEARVNLAHYTKDILVSDVIVLLFRLWDKDKKRNNRDVNSLYKASAILNANHSLKNFIINCYSQDKIITSEKAKKVIEQIPHANKHKILQDIQKYRNEKIGHNSNLQNKENTSLILGEIMIYADLTLKYASNFANIVLGKIANYSILPKESNYFLAIEELKKLLIDPAFQSKNFGIRKNALEYTDGDVFEAAKQILLDLEVDKDIFL